MKKILFFYFLFFISLAGRAQNAYVWNCTKDTVLNCSQSCITLKAFIPDIHTIADDYTVGPINSGSTNCFTPPIGINLPGNPTGLHADDTYTPIINLPSDFIFPFYGILYNSLVISTNGVISFDYANAEQFAHYSMLSAGTGLSATGSGPPVDLPDTRYDKAIIMGIYEDINPFYTTSPTEQIKYDIIGAYPMRKFILSFYKIPTYLTECENKINNSYQITLYENTGIIDVFVYGREICTGWNQGRAMIGLQNYERDKGIMPPGRAASDPIWGSPSMNEAWRFTPKGGPSALKSVELLDINGNLITAGDTAGVGDKLEVSFPNICPAVTTKYIVRSTYNNPLDPFNDIIGADTINVIKNTAIGAITENITQANCGSNGSITITAPAGPSIKYSIDGGTNSQLSNIFSVPAGTYTVIAKDTVSGCSSVKDITVTGSGTVTANAVATSASCPEALNGTITVTASLGTPAYTFAIDNPSSTYAPSNSFTGLDTGFHTIYVKDNAGCSFSFRKEVGYDDPFSTTADSTNASCSGVSNGTITVRQPAAGAAPFSYTITPGPATSQPLPSFTGLAAGSYNIKIKDNNGCSFSFTKGVGNNAGFTATADSTNTSCLGVNNGTLTVTQPLTGAAPFSYTITPGAATPQPSPSFTGLAAGSYNIKIKDNNGCSFSFTKGVGSNPGVSATDSTVITACNGASTGKIFVRTGAGVSPFTFSKDSGATFQPANSFINLAAGTYHIRVKDNVGCYYDFNSVVGFGAGVMATDSTVVSECTVASTGKIFIKPGLGIAPFQFSKDSGATYQPADSFINLLPHSYPVRVKDNVGCYYDFNATVGIGSGVSATDSSVVSACLAATTGKIFVRPGSGIAPFQFSKDSGLSYKPIDSFVNLAPGRYPMRVKDAAGCYYDFHSTVGIGAGVTASDSTIVSACATASTGKIFVRPGLGVPPFQFSNDSGVSYKLIDSFVNLTARSYPIRVKDAVGCYYDFNSTVGFGTGVNSGFVKINSACFGVSSGQIIVTPTAGIAPFRYSIDTGFTFQPVDTFKNLASGNYSIQIIDAVGCVYNSQTQVVGNNPGVSASYSLIKAACAGSATGAIIVKPTAGNAPFRYSLDGGTNNQFSDSVFRNLLAGPYTVTVTDVAGCVLNSPVQNLLDNPGVVTSPSIIQNSSCATIPNGAITVNVTAGVAPFTYKLTSVSGTAPQPGNIFPGLFSGSYDILISDSAGCTATISPVVGNNPKVKIDSVNVLRPSCNGLVDGIVTVNASLGVAPYQYAVDAVPYSDNKALSAIGAGSHLLHISDANGCVIDSSITVTEPAVLTNTLAGTSPSTCSGMPDGQIVVNAAGGTIPYEYTLDATAISGYQASPALSVISGSYVVTARDSKGCKASLNVDIDSVFTMFLDLGADTTICFGQSLVLNPNTNPQTSVFSYTPSATFKDAAAKNAIASPSDTIMYRLVAKWGICTLTDSIKVNVLHKPIPDAGPDVIICYDTTTALHASAGNLSGTINYSWSPAALLDTKSDTTDVIARPDTAQTLYTVTVTDNYGCNFAVTDQVLVTMLPPVYAFAGNDTNAVLDVPHQLHATGAGIGGSYEWYYPDPQGYLSQAAVLSDKSIADPTVIFQPVTQPGTFHPDTNYYKLAVLATNRAGCRQADTIKINVFIGPEYYTPTAFSPNGDGVNDIFRAVPAGINTEYFRIYNRYGELIFETNRFMQGWDGTYRGKPQLSGVYVWSIKGKDRNGIVIEKKGTVMLVR